MHVAAAMELRIHPCLVAACLAPLLTSFGAQETYPTPGGSPPPARVADLLGLRAPDADRVEVEHVEVVLHRSLDRLAACLRTGSDELEGLPLAAEFACSALRPADLDVREVDAARVVSRQRGGAPPPADQAGIDGLRGALEGLRAPFVRGDDGRVLRVALKVVWAGRPVGGSEQDDERLALVRMQIAANSAEEAREAVAHWIVRLGWDGEALELRAITTQGFEELVRRPGGPLLVDATGSVLAGLPAFEDQLRRGLDEWCMRLDARLGVSLLGHEGLALGDVDGDGRDDLYVLQPGGMPNRLLVWGDDGRMRDVSAAAGVDFLDPSRGALLLDLDGDGDQDLGAVVSEELLVLSNEGGWGEGKGAFALRSRLPAHGFFSLSAADVEGDGDLDLYGCSYVLPWAGETTPLPYHDAQNGSPNVLYRNEGEWRFSDATVELGLDVSNRRFSFAAAWEDFDDDGDQDLYVANDFGRNVLYRNDLSGEAGRFTDISAELGVEDLAAGMGVDWADVNGDGVMDLHVANMFSSAGGRIAHAPEFHPEADEPILAAFRRHARGDSLFLGRPKQRFLDVSRTAGIAMGRWAWGAIFVDFENDGAPDLYVPNGYVTGELKDDL